MLLVWILLPPPFPTVLFLSPLLLPILLVPLLKAAMTVCLSLICAA